MKKITKKLSIKFFLLIRKKKREFLETNLR